MRLNFIRKLIRRPLALLICLLFSYITLSCLISVLTYVCSDGGSQIMSDADVLSEKEDNRERNSFRNLWKSELPVCVDNLLDQRDYQYASSATSSTKDRLVSKTHPHYSCRLIGYTVNRAVTCFDHLSQLQVSNARNVTTKPNGKSLNLHFVFMGDSRMRQQFFYFLKVFSSSVHLLSFT